MAPYWYVHVHLDIPCVISLSPSLSPCFAVVLTMKTFRFPLSLLLITTTTSADAVALVLSVANLIGYNRCQQDAKARLASIALRL
jgi:hypothetical protein